MNKAETTDKILELLEHKTIKEISKELENVIKIEIDKNQQTISIYFADNSVFTYWL